MPGSVARLPEPMLTLLVLYRTCMVGLILFSGPLGGPYYMVRRSDSVPGSFLKSAD